MNSARKALYRQPFNYQRRPTWTQANLLLDALQANKAHLGRFVRDTFNIVAWIQGIDKHNFRFGGRGRTNTSGYHWYLDILQVCPLLQEVDLTFGSEEDLRRLFATLALGPARLPEPPDSVYGHLTLPRIRSITFEGSHLASAIPRTNSLSGFLETLEQVSLPSLDTVRLRVNFTLSGLASEVPQLPFDNIKHYEVSTFSTKSSSSLPPFPSVPSTVEHFLFHGSTFTDGAHLLVLPNLIPSTLRNLTISFERDDYWTLHRSICTNLSAPRVPCEVFESFPHLVSFDLWNSHGPSLALLRTLCHGSPNLTRIGFNGSQWFNNSNLTSTVAKDIFPEAQIVDTCRKFSSLKTLHLGILPTFDSAQYIGLKAALQADGIDAEYGSLLQD